MGLSVWQKYKVRLNRTYLTSERNLLSWLNGIQIIVFIAVRLFKYPQVGPRITGFVLILFSVFVLAYALWKFHARYEGLEGLELIGFTDKLGYTAYPIAFNIVLIIGVAVGYYYTVEYYSLLYPTVPRP